MLRSYLAVLHFEIAKAVRARITWVTLLLPVALCLLSVGWERAARGVQAVAVGGGAASLPSAYLGFARGAGNGFTLAGILLLLYAAMIVSGEGHGRTFKTIMLRPHRRMEWILGKFSLLLLLAGALIVLVAGAALLAGSAIGPYADVAEEGYVIFEARYLARSSILAVALVITPMIAVAAFGLAVSTLTDHTGIATSAALGAYVVLEMAKSSMRGGRNYLFNTFAPSLIDTSYFQALRGFAAGLSDTGWEEGVMTYSVVTPILWSAALLLIAMVIFSRRDFVT